MVLESIVLTGSWEIMSATSGAVIFSDDWKDSDDMAEGLCIPRPQRRVGRANRALSMEEQGGRPVRAGIKCWWISISNG